MREALSKTQVSDLGPLGPLVFELGRAPNQALENPCIGGIIVVEHGS